MVVARDRRGAMRRRTIVLGGLVLLLLGAAAGPLAAQQPRGRWMLATPLARGWEEVMGAAIRGKVYVFEGLEAFPRGYSGMAVLPVWRPYGGSATDAEFLWRGRAGGVK